VAVVAILKILLLPYPLSAQNLFKGEVYDILGTSFHPNIIGEGETNIFVADIKSDYRGGITMTLEAFNKKTLDRSFSKEYQVATARNPLSAMYLEAVSVLDGDVIYIVNSVRVKRKTSSSTTEVSSALKAFRIDGETGLISDSKTLISKSFQEPSDNNAFSANRRSTYSYSVVTSPNNKRIMVSLTTRDAELNRFFQKIHVFDSELNLLKEKELIKSEDELYELVPGGVTMDDEGSIYYWDQELVILDYYKDYEEWREPVPMDNFESNADLGSISGSFDSQGDIVITGTYLTTDIENTSEPKMREERMKGDTQLEGLMFMKVNTMNQEIELVRISKFEQNLIDEFLTKDLLDQSLEPEVNDVFNSFSYDFSGDHTYVIGEAVEIEKKAARFGDLLVCSFDKEGNLDWAHRVPRLQKSKSKLSCYGLMTFFDSDYIYLLFQDEKSNFNEKGERNELGLKELSGDAFAVPVLYRFDKKTGAMNYSVRPRWTSGGTFVINPNYSLTTNDGIYVFMKDENNYRLTRISFDEYY
jgi:hypothetical protein